MKSWGQFLTRADALASAQSLHPAASGWTFRDPTNDRWSWCLEGGQYDAFVLGLKTSSRFRPVDAQFFVPAAPTCAAVLGSDEEIRSLFLLDTRPLWHRSNRFHVRERTSSRPKPRSLDEVRALVRERLGGVR